MDKLGRAIGTALLTACLALPATSSSATAALPPGRMTIDVVTVNGSGCPAGTAAVAAAPDNTSFSVTYSDYVAEAGPRTTAVDSRKNCQLALRISMPQGYTYAVERIDHRGSASLAAGADGRLRTNYYFQGNRTEDAAVTHTFAGPLSGSWRHVDESETEHLIYAPCGEQRILNVNTSLVVDAGTSNPARTNLLSMDATRGSISTLVQLRWAQC